MDSFEFSGLTPQQSQLISLNIRVMTAMPGKVVRLEQIRANSNLSCYSDAQISMCIWELVDDGWCDLSCSNPETPELKNGYIYRRA